MSLLRALLAVPALILAGCITGNYREGSEIPWERVAQIIPGETTKSEILDQFGAPQNFSAPTAMPEFFESRGLEASSYSRYPFTDVFTYQLSRGKLRGFIAIFYNRFRIDIVSDLVVIFFDEQGVVANVGVRRAPPRE